jgi:hypothetical protein
MQMEPGPTAERASRSTEDFCLMDLVTYPMPSHWNIHNYHTRHLHYHNHHLFNVPTAGTFLMDCLQRGYNPSRGPSADWWVLTTANTAGTNDLTCLPKHGGARDNEFLVTHLMTDHCYLASAIVRRAH